MSTFAILALLAACSEPADDKENPVGDDTGAPGAPAIGLARADLDLTELGEQAVAAAPSWVRDDLAITLGQLDATTQDDVAMQVVDLDEPWLLDEVAFSIAHTSPEVFDRPSFHPEVFQRNAALLYEIDDALDYVELVDEGEPGVDDDFWTTATYRVQAADGTVEEHTVDPEIYYWYVVHPRLEDEIPAFVDGWDSARSVDPDAGWHWREFLWSEAAASCPPEDERGCPVLDGWMDGVDVLWTGATDATEDGGAVGRIFDFVDAVMTFGAGAERPVQPVRIYALGVGNCGEYADLGDASARTALIPARNVGAFANDHTWDEFWDERWVKMDVTGTQMNDTSNYYGGISRNGRDDDCDGIADYGYLATDADGDGVRVSEGDCDDTDPDVHPGAEEVADGRDQDCDGIADDGADTSDADGDGWTIADGDCDDTDPDVNPDAEDPGLSSNRLFLISAARGDTHISTDRTADYGAQHSTLDFTVTDRDGNPVEGAVITIYGTWAVYGYPDAWAWAGELVTDIDGHASTPAGESNPYGYTVASALGNRPATGGLYELTEETLPGETYSAALEIGEMPAPPEATPAEAGTGMRLAVSLSVESHRISADGAYEGSMSLYGDGGDVDVYVVDDDGLALLDAGEAFPAALAETDVDALDTTVEVDAGRAWNVVLANLDRVAATMVGTVSVGAEDDGGTASAERRFRLGPGETMVLRVEP